MSATEVYYRVTANNIGIYAAVDCACPKDDPRRDGKPDGSWLAKKGEDFPGAISYWTKAGWQKYRASGLYEWHRSVVNGAVQVEESERPENIVYEDEYQVIVGPEVSEKENEQMRALREEGYDHVFIWNGTPDETDPEHVHGYDTLLIVIAGEIEIILDGVQSNHIAGEVIHIPRGTLHSARTGTMGCRYLVAEKY